MIIGGGAGSRTRVQNESIIRSFTSLVSFSKLTKYPQIFPFPVCPRKSTCCTRVTINGLVYFGGTNHLSGFDNKVTGYPAIKQLRRNRTQHCRWQLKFVTLSIHVSPLDTCTFKFSHSVETSSPPFSLVCVLFLLQW